MIRTLILAFHRHLKSTPNPTPLPSARLHCNFTHVGEYVQIVHALALSTPTTPSDETMGILHLLHPHVEVDFPHFVDDFHLETKVILDQEAFVFALAHSPHLPFGGPFGMVYELL
jgi:hypothetical protein